MSVNRTKRQNTDTTKAILTGLTSYLEGTGEQPDREVGTGAPLAKEPRKPLKINSRVLGEVRRNVTRKRLKDQNEKPSIFTPAVPAPGVLPKGHAAIAMDEMPMGDMGTFGALNGWAWGNGVQFAEGTTFLGYPYLAELFQRPEYRKIIERVATEMTRKWIKIEVTSDVDGKLDDAEKKARIQSKSERIKGIEKRMVELRVRDAFRVAAEHDNGFGRGHIFLDIGGVGKNVDMEELKTSVSTNGKVSKLKVNPKTPLRAVRNIEPMWAYPHTYNSSNPLSPDWYRPSTWYVMATPVDSSRLLTLVGREVPDILKPAYSFGGLAMTQMAKPYVDNWLRTRQAVCDLIESFSVSGVYTNMATILQGGDDCGDGGIMDRMELFNLIRTNSGSMVLDKETEEFFNISTPLGTLDALQAQAQEQMASVSSIPVAILLGLQPKGLNASSEAEVRIFYDFILASQENIFRDPLKVVIDMIQLSEFGEIDEEITFSFEPLWSLSDKERAEVKKIEAETGTLLIDAGVLDPIEERRRIANDPEMGYASIDVEDVPERPEEGAEGDGFDDGDEGKEEADEAPAAPEKPKPAPSDRKDAPAKDGIVPFLVSGAQPAMDAEWDESKHPRAPDGKFGAGSGGGASSAEASAKGAVKKAVSAFGGLWKETGKGDKADFQATAAYYLGKEPKSGTHYRNMLKKLIDGAAANGLGEVQQTALKGHLFKALATVKDKLSEDYSKATDDGEKKKLEKLFNNATKQQKDLGFTAKEGHAIKKGAEAPAPAPVAAKPETKAAPAAAKGSAQEKFEQNTKGFSAEAMKNHETMAKEKIKAVAQTGGSLEDANAMLSYAEKVAIEKSYHKTVEKNLEASKAHVEKAGAAEKAAQIASENAKKEAAAFEASLNSPEAKEHYEALEGIMSGNAKAALANAAKKLKALGKAYENMTPGDAAQVMAYSGSFYKEVNSQLRAGVMTEQQYKFAASLNKALDTMPKYEGVTRRGVPNMTPAEIAMYKPGMIVEERGFMSTSTGMGFSGNVRFDVHGKSGRDISKLSHYPGEAEVLFKAGTRFKVISNVNNKITLEEVKFGGL